MADSDNLKFTNTHEWVRIEGDTAVVGITKHAEEELGDVALVQLPEVGRMLQREEKFGEIESIKAVSELYSPVSGEVTAVNDSLESAPEGVNADPYGAGWMVKIRLANPSETDGLLKKSEYDALVAE
jgi:glycine cleavage system H protein